MVSMSILDERDDKKYADATRILPKTNRNLELNRSIYLPEINIEIE